MNFKKRKIKEEAEQSNGFPSKQCSLSWTKGIGNERMQHIFPIKVPITCVGKVVKPHNVYDYEINITSDLKYIYIMYLNFIFVFDIYSVKHSVTILSL